MIQIYDKKAILVIEIQDQEVSGRLDYLVKIYPLNLKTHGYEFQRTQEEVLEDDGCNNPVTECFWVSNKEVCLATVGILRQQIIFFTSSSSLKWKYLAYTIFIGTFFF